VIRIFAVAKMAQPPSAAKRGHPTVVVRSGVDRPSDQIVVPTLATKDAAKMGTHVLWSGLNSKPSVGQLM